MRRMGHGHPHAFGYSLVPSPATPSASPILGTGRPA